MTMAVLPLLVLKCLSVRITLKAENFNLYLLLCLICKSSSMSMFSSFRTRSKSYLLYSGIREFTFVAVILRLDIGGRMWVLHR